jgi:hypothetical protein
MAGNVTLVAPPMLLKKAFAKIVKNQQEKN